MAMAEHEVETEQSDTNNSVLLLTDVNGLKENSGLLSKLSTTFKLTIEKGALLDPIVKPIAIKRDGQSYYHNYCLSSRPAVTLYCMEQEIFYLNKREFMILKAITSRRERLKMYYEGVLEWGAKLCLNDRVYVSLPSKTRSGFFTNVAAIVKYIGKVEHSRGIQFGVEIEDPDYRGCGTSDGGQYFTCDHNCAVFVSLNKLHRQPTTEFEENLDLQSRVQIPFFNSGMFYVYGVIRWMGILPRSAELSVGIELDEKVAGCTDGTHRDSGKKFFSCPPGRGFYCPMTDVKPDTRFIDHEADSIVNPLESAQDEEQEDQQIAENQIQKYIGEERGIQGHHNSCFLDATVFGLFAVSYEFDKLVQHEYDDPVKTDVSQLLWKGIINPLRKNHVVKFDSVMRLRTRLEEVGRLRGITQEEKDPEEFLNMLFKYTLEVPPFISIRRPFGVEEEYFVQLFLEPDESLKLPSVGHLLDRMFKEQSISFTKVPSKLLIQVPRFGRQFKTFEKIVPEIKLDVTSLVDVEYEYNCAVCKGTAKRVCNKCISKENESRGVHFCEKDDCWDKLHEHYLGHVAECSEEVNNMVQDLFELELLSVICIETSHYVCFTRSDKQWVFFDSMANRINDKFNIPQVVDCTQVLNEWVYTPDSNRSRLLNTRPRDLPEYVRRFTQDVYLCVYIRTLCATDPTQQS